jgi:hypothetical protein
MSDFTLSCTNQRKQRSRFFFHLAGDASSRYNLVSPYIYETSLGNKLVYSQEDLNMRRKVEVLKYSTKDYNKLKTQNYSYLAKKNTKTRPCPAKNIETPSSSCDVPGPVIQLFENPDIPLYNYKDTSRQFTVQNKSFDNYKRIFDTFPIYNIISKNNTYVNLMDIIILNPDNNQFRFDFSIPISLEYSANFNGISSIYDVHSSQIAIFSSVLDIMYSDTIISSNNINYRTSGGGLDSDIVFSTKSVSFDFAESTIGEVKVRQYIGNLILKNVTIQTVTQYVYTLFIKTNTNYAEYSGDIDNPNPFRFNDTGTDINNSNASNVTNVSYKYITNFNNTDPNLANIVENCEVIFGSEQLNEGEDITDIPFIPFNISAYPV